MMDSDCLFCKIIAGTIPSIKIMEDDQVIVFMDIMPQSDGHCLVVPKQHGANLWDIDDDHAQAVIRTVRRLAPRVKSAMDADGVSVMQLNGAAAGQTVFHVHAHIIPRKAGADLRMHARDRADAAALAVIAKKIIDACA